MRSRKTRGGLSETECKGRPRKPLAEVILRSAPLRATSSGVLYCTYCAVRKSFILKAPRSFCRVGFALHRARFTFVSRLADRGSQQWKRVFCCKRALSRTAV